MHGGLYFGFKYDFPVTIWDEDRGLWYEHVSLSIGLLFWQTRVIFNYNIRQSDI